MNCGRKHSPVVAITFLLLFIVACSLHFICFDLVRSIPVRSSAKHQPKNDETLVSYAYFEKDPIQRENFEFFLKKGVGLNTLKGEVRPRHAHFAIVVTGKTCTPCEVLAPHVSQVKSTAKAVDKAWAGPRITLLQRFANVGMDIAAHNVRPISSYQARVLEQVSCN